MFSRNDVVKENEFILKYMMVLRYGKGLTDFDQHVEEIVIEDYSDLMMGGFVRDSKQLRLLSL